MTYLANTLLWLARALALTLVLGLIGVLAAGYYAMHYRGYRLSAVQTGSMIPTLHVGDGVVIEPVSYNNLKPGDVISYRSGNGTVTHRIASISSRGGSVTTKGDHNPNPDSPISKGQIIGKVVVVAPLIGNVRKVLQKPILLVVVIYLPATALIVWEVRSIELGFKKPYRLHSYSGR